MLTDRTRKMIDHAKRHLVKKSSAFWLALFCVLFFPVGASAKDHNPVCLSGTKGNSCVWMPEKHVLCDRYDCYSAKEGVSVAMTRKYLKKDRVKKLRESLKGGGVDLTEFTMANGVYCDTKQKLCRVSRYYVPNASGSAGNAWVHDKVDDRYTRLLFGTE